MTGVQTCALPILGDDFGDNQATLDRICEEFGLTEDEVLNILQGDYDTDPAEYA